MKRLEERLAACALLVPMLAGCTWTSTALWQRHEDARAIAERARAAESGGDADEAARLWARAVHRDPQEVGFRRELALLHRSRNDVAAEVAQWNHVVRLAPDDSRAWCELARALQRRVDRAAAVDAVTRALALEPRSPDALLVWAEVAESAGREDEAAAAYHRLLEVDPGHVAGRLGLAGLQMNAGQPALAAPVLRSLCDCPRACRDVKEDAWWTLGLAYGGLQRWRESADALSAAGELEGDLDVDERYRLAYAHYRAGDVRAARRALGARPEHEPSRALAAHLDESFDVAVAGAPGRLATPEVPVPPGW